MKTQTMMSASEVRVDCPYCHSQQDGFIGDPRNETVDCEDCGKTFHIPPDADIELR
ncbi:hypothetical protein MHM99_19850 [Alteromonas sp. MmMcT2-2]|uniref:hypothetical protein n=1 Tax=Alteromonas sp. MmMcT2-2 TaxID=2917732 RepID=UPI001EF37B6B|nr:hypothetical protein [Alteromonas sp. MmMcT2-2]MCG7643739.1 hypothetical protein [Alteromonas sp. MmMcT2-2]